MDNPNAEKTAGRRTATLNKEDIWGENVYEEMWLPFGDERENDIQSLLQQGRIGKY